MKTNPLFLLAVFLSGPLSAFEIIYDEKGATRHEAPAAPQQPLGEFVVVWAKVDLRREPVDVAPDAVRKKPYAVDDLQETQLLYGEVVNGYELRDGWMRVLAVEQPEFTHNNRWEGYPGWVPVQALKPRHGSLAANAVVTRRYAKIQRSRWWWSRGEWVPMGSRLFVPLVKKSWMEVTGMRGERGWMRAKDLLRAADYPSQPDDVRRRVLAAAKQFIGEPYYWGGRAGHRPSEKVSPSGIDCSALVNLGFRSAGYEVPRDSHEQFMASRAIGGAGEMRPADLIFLAKEGKPGRMTHVMLYAGGDDVIEAVHEFNVVRRVSVKKKLGRPLAELKPGDKVVPPQSAGTAGGSKGPATPAAGYVVYFGRLVP